MNACFFIKQEIWGRSSVGRAPALQAGGQEFESLRLHLKILFLQEFLFVKTNVKILWFYYWKRLNIVLIFTSRVGEGLKLGLGFSLTI